MSAQPAARCEQRLRAALLEYVDRAGIDPDPPLLQSANVLGAMELGMAPVVGIPGPQSAIGDEAVQLCGDGFANVVKRTLRSRSCGRKKRSGSIFQQKSLDPGMRDDVRQNAQAEEMAAVVGSHVEHEEITGSGRSCGLCASPPRRFCGSSRACPRLPPM